MCPSGPVALPRGGTRPRPPKPVQVPLGVIRPTPLSPWSVNQRLPSGPTVMSYGVEPPAVGNSVIVPSGAMQPIGLGASPPPELDRTAAPIAQPSARDAANVEWATEALR